MKQTRNKRPERCLDCKQLMRAFTTPPQQAPGTVIHGAKGLCDTCYSRHQRGGYKLVKQQSNVLTDNELAIMRTEHPHAYQYHRNRRDRGVPAEGLTLQELREGEQR